MRLYYSTADMSELDTIIVFCFVVLISALFSTVMVCACRAFFVDRVRRPRRVVQEGGTEAPPPYTSVSPFSGSPAPAYSETRGYRATVVPQRMGVPGHHLPGHTSEADKPPPYSEVI